MFAFIFFLGGRVKSLKGSTAPCFNKKNWEFFYKCEQLTYQKLKKQKENKLIKPKGADWKHVSTLISQP